MENNENPLHRVPEVDIRELEKRKLLEAQLFSLDAQIRNFGRIRDRLTDAGEDNAVYYKKTQERRNEILKAFRKIVPVNSSPLTSLANSPFQRPDDLLLSLPIAPARFIRDLGVFGFGTSGVVQMAAASEGNNIVEQGKHPSYGEIITIPGAYPGAVTYSGQLNVGPESIPPNQYDPSIDYFWIHNWKYLVPFPPPPVESLLTYRFDVYARTSVFFGGGEAMAMAFVSVGETNNLTTGNDVVVNRDGGWPLMADLTQPAPYYNGHYGFVEGDVTVQRTFKVPGGHVPAVAIVVGSIAALSMMTEVRLVFSNYSSISVGSQNMTGRVSYSYEPLLVAHQ